MSSARPQARAAEFWSWGLGGIARGKTALASPKRLSQKAKKKEKIFLKKVLTFTLKCDTIRM